MLDRAYRKRLAVDLPKWRESGWVTEDGATAILASLPPARAALGLATVIAMLGGLLVGLSVIAFISANWQEIPRLARFVLLAVALALAYGAAGTLERRQLRIFAEVALLVAGLIFAAAIALVGQSYHLSGEFADAVLLWLIGIFVAAALTGSPTTTALGLVGGGFWTWTVTWDLGAAPHWAGLVPVILGGAIATVIDSRNTRILAVLALIFWAVLAILSSADRYDWSFAGGMTLSVALALALFAAGGLTATFGEGRIAALGGSVLWPALAAILVAVGILQAASEPSVGEQGLISAGVAAVALAATFAAVAFMRKGLTVVDVGAIGLLGVGALLFTLNVPEAELWARLAGGALAMAAALWAVSLGQSGYLGAAKSTGMAAIGIEVIYLYAVTFGTLMNTAIAFMLGGVLFIVLGWALYRFDRHLAGRGTGASAAAGEAKP